MTSPEAAVEKRPVSLWKRLLVGGSLFLLLMTGLIVGVTWLHRDRLGKTLRDTLVQLDEADPGWRLADLEAARPQVPDAENSALVISAAHRLLPKDWPTQAIVERIDAVSPPLLLDAPTLEALQRETALAGAARVEARRTADMPRGRFPREVSADTVIVVVDEEPNSSRLALLLFWDALLQAHKGRPGEAMRSCRAILHTARAMEQEPFLVSQWISKMNVATCCSALERVLALGEPPAGDLAALQQMLQQEDRRPALLLARRGERAIHHNLFVALAEGRPPFADLLGHPALKDRSLAFRARYMKWALRDQARAEHPRMLELMSKAVANAQLPMHEQDAAEKMLDAEIMKEATPGSLLKLLPLSNESSRVFRHRSAQVRSMIALLAVERYRQEKGAWPATLAALTPRLLAGIPLDPFDGKPLRYRTTKDGVIVYSVGEDGKDDGGLLRPLAKAAASLDVGYQLWDRALRRQPPPRPRVPPP